MRVKKIISGGQSGVDRMGLEVGKELGLQTGGAAPKNYNTEFGFDFTLIEFGLKASESTSYKDRTLQNIINSNGTVLFGDVSSSGSQLTTNLCKTHQKPIIINPSVEQMVEWLTINEIVILNVAGNRRSRITWQKLKESKEVLLTAINIQNERT